MIHTPLRFYLDPGNAPVEVIQRVFEALNGLNIAYGGLGYRFENQGDGFIHAYPVTPEVNTPPTEKYYTVSENNGLRIVKKYDDDAESQLKIITFALAEERPKSAHRGPVDQTMEMIQILRAQHKTIGALNNALKKSTRRHGTIADAIVYMFVGGLAGSILTTLLL